jgi:hypothetical protein
MHSVMLSFICTTGDCMMIHFLRKRCLSVSTTRAIRRQNRGIEKFESLKYFEVRGVHKKEPWDKWIRFINPMGTIICPTQEIKVKTSPDWVIIVSIRSVPSFSGYLVGL